jgi:hypothetical protein
VVGICVVRHQGGHGVAGVLRAREEACDEREDAGWCKWRTRGTGSPGLSYWIDVGYVYDVLGMKSMNIIFTSSRLP